MSNARFDQPFVVCFSVGVALPSDAMSPRRARGLLSGKHLHQCGGINRLHHMMIEAGFLRPATVFLVTPAGDGDQQSVVSPRLLANMAADVITVHFGHAD